MAITLRYFAAVREALGVDAEQVELAALGDPPTVDALWRWLEARHAPAARWRGHVRLAVDHDFTDDPDLVLTDEVEVALIPPVSGGSTRRLERDEGRFVMTTAPLDERAVEALVRRDDAGAVVTFTGRVRDHTGDHQVNHLVYEAYEEMALAKLAETADEAHAQWERLAIAIHHRWGRLGIGEAAVVISVSSPHRAPAFAACQFIIDRLKQVVPIWKKEVGPDGSEWVGWGP